MEYYLFDTEGTLIHKRCPGEGHNKDFVPVADFGTNKKGKHGLAPRCRACMRAADKKRPKSDYYARNRERLLGPLLGREKLNLPDEVWKPVPDYPDYAASNLGRVKRLAGVSAKGSQIREKVLVHSEHLHGYTHVRLLTTTILVHRVVFAAFHGEFPDSRLYVVDHKDGDATNNAISNLRLATRRENQQNRKVKSGGRFKGISLFAGKWVAAGSANGERHYLGRFDDPVEAAKAYDAFALEHHGKFAKLNFC